MPLSDWEIIEKVKLGNTSWFRELVLRYQDKVLRLCYSMLGPDSAEDAAQEVFIKVFKSLDQFQGRSSFSTWLYRVATNHCLNILAQRKIRREESLDALMEKTSDHAVFLQDRGGDAAATENQQLVQALLAALSPEEKTILTLRELQGLTYQEIAEALDLSVDNVKVRIFRARKTLMKAAQEMKVSM